MDGVTTFDIYVNDQKVGSNVNDYYNTSVLGRSTYEIKNIQPSDDYVYDGVASGSLSGTVSGNTEIKLKFTKKTNLNFDVSYDANGGSNAPATQTKEYGKELTLSTAAPTRKGYTFMGWATSANANKAEYQPGDVYNGDAALTLYAVWEEVGITGYTGDATWNLTSSGQLIVSGKGAMKNYGAASQTRCYQNWQLCFLWPAESGKNHDGRQCHDDWRLQLQKLRQAERCCLAEQLDQHWRSCILRLRCTDQC